MLLLVKRRRFCYVLEGFLCLFSAFLFHKEFQVAVIQLSVMTSILSLSLFLSDIVNNRRYMIVITQLRSSVRAAVGLKLGAINTLLSSLQETRNFAFGNIMADLRVDLSGLQPAYNDFNSQTDVKRVLSFGGWIFSTDYDIYPIFRKGVTPAHRDAFAQNVVNVSIGGSGPRLV